MAEPVPPRVRTLAAALAGALLDGALTDDGWTRPAMVARTARVLGRERVWLRALADEVLRAHPRPPVDAPRALALLVARSAALARGTARGVPRPRVHPVPPARMAERVPWDVPRLDGVRDVAELLDLDVEHLLWYADPAGLQRRAPEGPLHHYRYRWLTKRSGAPRLLEAPRPRLRALQRRVLDEVLVHLPVHPAAHGFVRGRSPATAAAPHAGQAVVVALDLEAFFASLAVGRVHGVLRRAGYPEAVAHLLAALCTTAAPVRVLTTMPAGGSPEERHRVRRHLAAPHLPQGSPTSPALANLCVARLDRRLAGLAAAAGAAYTRYADDLVLSGGPGVARRAGRLVDAVRRVAREEGLRTNPAKTRVQRHGQRQLVTGVVVNERPTVPRAERDRLRAVLHNCRRHGPSTQDREGTGDLRAHLTGRVAWVASVDPVAGERLRAQLLAIDWSR